MENIMKELYIYEKNGKRRRALEHICQQCGKIFLKRINITKNFKFCSRQCYDSFHKSTNKLPNVICANCGKYFYKNNSQKNNSKSGLYFCCRKCKDSAQKIGGIKEIMPPHYGTAQTLDPEQYRALFTELEMVCRRCGYKEFKSLVYIHHIDEDRSNNNKSNLIPLCSNCHRALHLKLWKLEE